MNGKITFPRDWYLSVHRCVSFHNVLEAIYIYSTKAEAEKKQRELKRYYDVNYLYHVDWLSKGGSYWEVTNKSEKVTDCRK
jgi:hypothetical protein